MVSTDNTVKLAPGVTSVVKLVDGPVQEMVGTGLPCAVQLNVAWCDWFTVRSVGEPRMKGWAGQRGGGEEVADSESVRYSVWVCGNIQSVCGRRMVERRSVHVTRNCTRDWAATVGVKYALQSGRYCVHR